MAERVAVKRRGSGVASWMWTCPCCLNFPGRGGYVEQSDALDGALAHVADMHPDMDGEMKAVEQWLSDEGGNDHE